MNRRSFLNAISLAPAATLVPSLVLGGAEANAALSTWPHIIYKENDRILSDFEPADTVSLAFNALVRSENRKIEPQGARLAMNLPLMGNTNLVFCSYLRSGDSTSSLPADQR